MKKHMIKKFESFINNEKYSEEVLELAEYIIKNKNEIILTGGEDEQSPTPENFINFEFKGDDYTLAKDVKSLSFGYSSDSGTINYQLPKTTYKKLLEILDDKKNNNISTTDWDEEEKKFNDEPIKRLNKYKNV
jgi:hypothetical protein